MKSKSKYQIVDEVWEKRLHNYSPIPNKRSPVGMQLMLPIHSALQRCIRIFILEASAWQTPAEYFNLTKRSIYSIPKFPEYPFLDPHWIVRIDGRREVGPNAVPIFGPYAYNWIANAKYLIPKIIESIRARGTYRILLDRRFLSLLGHEVQLALKNCHDK